MSEGIKGGVRGSGNVLALNEGDEEVEDDAPHKACNAVKYHEEQGGKQEGVAAEVVAEVEVLELEREHREVADHSGAHGSHEEDADGGAGVAVAGNPACESNPEDSVGGDGESAEGACLAAVVVEFGQAQGAKGRQKEGGEAEPPGALRGKGEHSVEEHHRRGHAEAHEVGEGVEVLAQGRVSVQEASAGAVAEVKQGGCSDGNPAPLQAGEGAEGF